MACITGGWCCGSDDCLPMSSSGSQTCALGCLTEPNISSSTTNEIISQAPWLMIVTFLSICNDGIHAPTCASWHSGRAPMFATCVRGLHVDCWYSAPTSCAQPLTHDRTQASMLMVLSYIKAVQVTSNDALKGSAQNSQTAKMPNFNSGPFGAVMKIYLSQACNVYQVTL